MSPAGPGFVSLRQALVILHVSKSAYPAVILCVFLVGFVVVGVITAPKEDDKVEVDAQKGPGGRPLPVRRKSASQVKEAAAITDFSPSAKLIFRSLSAGVLITFVINGAAIVLQVIVNHKWSWWPGQSAVVSTTIGHVLEQRLTYSRYS